MECVVLGRLIGLIHSFTHFTELPGMGPRGHCDRLGRRRRPDRIGRSRTRSSSLRVPERVMSIAGKVRLGEERVSCGWLGKLGMSECVVFRVQ